MDQELSREESEHSSVIIDNKLVIAGRETISVLNLLEEGLLGDEWFDIVTDKYIKRLHPLICAISNTTILVGGGISSNDILNDIMAIDLITMEITQQVVAPFNFHCGANN